MADTRPADDPTTALADLQKQFDDLKSTLLARTARLPTGTMLGTLLSAAPANTVFLQGQTLQKTAFPVLWQWASDNSPGGFTVSASTLVVPDLRDRVLIGAGAAALGTVVGANTITLSTAQMPNHGHAVTVNSVGDHNHGISGDGGNHGNHNSNGFQVASALQGSQAFFFQGTDNTLIGNSGHSHGGGTGNNGRHGHTVNQSNAGSGSPVDIRQSSFAVNVLIYT